MKYQVETELLPWCYMHFKIEFEKNSGIKYIFCQNKDYGIFRVCGGSYKDELFFKVFA